MSEHDEQVALFEWAALMERRYPALRWLHAVPNGGLRPYRMKGNRRYSVEAMRLKREGVKRGVPDVCLPYPAGGYHGLYIEMKCDRNRMTPEQQEWGEYLKRTGYAFGVYWSWLDASNAIIRYLEGDWDAA